MKLLLHAEWLPLLITVVTLAGFGRVVAQGQQSLDYAVVGNASHAGGGGGESAAYHHEGSFGGVTGVSESWYEDSMETKVLHGYVGQLYEGMALEITVMPSVIPESSAGQLTARKLLDDGSYLAVSQDALQWSVLHGPISAVDSGGVFVAKTVAVNREAEVQATLDGVIGRLSFQVLNIGHDDHGLYAGDGLDDAWQVRFFDEENPLAVPDQDPDGDGFSNADEYLVGTLPNDPFSLFRLKVLYSRNAAEPALQWDSLPGRFYEVQSSSSLNPEDWTTLETLEGFGEEMTWPDQRPDLNGRVMYRVRVRR